MALFWLIILASVSGLAGTSLGGVCGAYFRRDSERTIGALLAFAAGVMISVVCFDLLPSALTAVTERASLPTAAAGMVIGYTATALAGKAIDSRILRGDGKLSSRGLFSAGVIMAAALALHNLPEGMVIGASFAHDGGYIRPSGSAVILAFVLGLHDIPEGMAVSVPLVGSGSSRHKAVGAAVLSGVPTVIGAVLGYCIGSVGDTALALSLSFAGGAMLFVVLGELIPQAIIRCKSGAAAIFVGLTVGFLLVFM